MTDRLAQLSTTGVAVWSTGGLARLRREFQVVGVTSNPTIFAKALSDANDYAEQVRDLGLRGVDVDTAAQLLTTYDVHWAYDAPGL